MNLTKTSPQPQQRDEMKRQAVFKIKEDIIQAYTLLRHWLEEVDFK